jgi:glycosyltransferase involved in cell wall biosynthesis
LYNVLKDLSNQTILPKNVIIVEQNADPNSVSELDYLFNDQWPFNIRHNFIHRTGVCNARNLALQQVTSEWILLGDDDNRFKSDLIQNLLDQIRSLGKKVVTTVYIQPNEKQTFFKTSQTQIFGGGNSLLNSKLLEKVKFDSAYEFGYGEDNDFGMQIRNLGEDVIFASDILITHLKAPIGGYRIKHKNEWDDEKYVPKPSPTIMLFNQRYLTDEQILGYKLLLFIKFYRGQSIKNPFRYISQMNKRWNSSLYWSKILENKMNA